MKQFSDLVVIELGGSVAGAYCGKLFADHGGQVIVVGDDQLGSHQRTYLQAGKSAASWFDPADADVIIESSALDPLVPVELDPSAVARAVLVDGQDGRRAVRVQLSPFGSSGPYAGWRGTDLTDYGLSGHLYLTGDPAREPLRGPANQPAFAAGLFGFVGAMAALFDRERTGRAQTVEVSHVESMTALHQFTLLCYTLTGRRLCRLGNRFTGLGQPNGLYRAADGWLAVTAVTEAQVDMLLAVTGLEHLLDHPGITSSLDFQSHHDLLDDALVPWLAERTVEEVTELFQAVRIPAAAARTIDDLLADPHLAERDYWQPHGPHLAPRSPLRFSHRQPSAGRRWRHPPADARLGDGLPLAGLRVLDLTRVWAGPLANRVLADLGADVVCVEAPWARGPKELPESAVLAAGYYPGDDQGDNQANRNPHFAKYALQKRSLVLDLTKEAGRASLEAMVGSYDVLVENYAPRVMPQLGLDEDRLHQLNPDLIYVTMPGYGRTGPIRDWLAYGTTVDSYGALSSLIGYPGHSPWKSGVAWPDPMAGLHAAAGVLMALWDREASDGSGGVTVECAQYEVTVAVIGDRVLEAQADGLPVPDGNRDRSMLAQGVYPCAGDDRWIAVSVPDQRAWSALCELAGLADGLITDHDRLDATLAAWTKDFDASDLAVRLQATGVPAAPVHDAPGLLADPHFAAREGFVTVDQPGIGPLITAANPIRLAPKPLNVWAPAPLFGQHNRELLASDAGLDPAAIDEFYASGVTADEPPF